MNIKTILIASAIALTGISGANAADAIQYQEPVPVNAAPVFSWSGGYLGGQVGYGWGKSTFTGSTFPSSLKPDGFLAGVYAGYNFAVSENVILGIDGDITYNNLKDGAFEDLGAIVGTENELRWSGAVRARAGYAIDRFLPYIAGGVAFGNVKNTGYMDLLTDYISTTKTKTLTGFTVGSGVDYAATDNLILRLEYRYTDYGRKHFSGSGTVIDFDTDNKFKTNEIRVGLAYKF